MTNQMPFHEISIDTRAIYDRLSRASVGETISYTELTQLIGRNVQDMGRGALHSARRMALRDNQIVFGVVRNEGLRRLGDVEIVQTGESTVTKLRRVARRGVQTITAVADFDAMPNDAKIKHNTFASMLGAIASMTKPASVKRLEAAVNTAQTGALPIGRTLEVFTK